MGENFHEKRKELTEEEQSNIQRALFDKQRTTVIVLTSGEMEGDNNKRLITIPVIRTKKKKTMFLACINCLDKFERRCIHNVHLKNLS